MPMAEGESFAGYTVVRLLGVGGMGEVYLARHPRLPRNDALKVLPRSVTGDGEYRARFEREADVAATLWHPNIVAVHDRGEWVRDVRECVPQIGHGFLDVLEVDLDRIPSLEGSGPGEHFVERDPKRVDV